jgi:hypothetical protein
MLLLWACGLSCIAIAGLLTPIVTAGQQVAAASCRLLSAQGALSKYALFILLSVPAHTADTRYLTMIRAHGRSVVMMYHVACQQHGLHLLQCIPTQHTGHAHPVNVCK